jgi:multiple sugar transport system permease protein
MTEAGTQRLGIGEGRTPVGRELRPSPRGKLVRRRERKGMGFVSPFMIAFLLFLLTPFAYAVYLSFYTTKIIGGTSFSGLANYGQVLTSGEFWFGVVRIAIFGAVQIPLLLLIAFFFATVFDLEIARFGRVFRTIFFVPFAVPSVIGAVMWSMLLAPSFGPFTQLAGLIGLHGVDFFSGAMILPTIILISIWEWTGWNMIILYTALRSVPHEVVEAAVIDGATIWSIVTRVKLPIVRSVIVMIVFLNLIGASQLFTEPLLISYFQAEAIPSYFTPTLYIYNTAISGQQYNLASAAAVVLGAFVALISIASLSFRRRTEALI